MVQYCCYDIYNVEDANLINSGYLERIEERRNSADDVSMFIDETLIPFSDLDTTIAGIFDTIQRGQLDELKSFVESHLNEILNSQSAYADMRRLINSSNLNEFNTRMDDLKKRLNEAKNNLTNTSNQLEQAKQTISNLDEDLAISRRDLSQANKSLSEFREMATSGSPVIHRYQTLQLFQIPSMKAKHILYFKEISYVPYVNSLMMHLLHLLSTKYKVKMLIYDNANAGNILYSPLRLVNGAEFASSKQLLLSLQTKCFVVTEPVPSILSEVLSNITPAYDIVIVYDRLKMMENLIDGNIVHKYYVINSKHDYDVAKSKFSINRTNTIITRPDNVNIAPDVIDIPMYNGYNDPNKTDAARLSMYGSGKTAITKKLLMDSILSIPHIVWRNS